MSFLPDLRISGVNSSVPVAAKLIVVFWFDTVLDVFVATDLLAITLDPNIDAKGKPTFRYCDGARQRWRLPKRIWWKIIKESGFNFEHKRFPLAAGLLDRFLKPYRKRPRYATGNPKGLAQARVLCHHDLALVDQTTWL